MSSAAVTRGVWIPIAAPLALYQDARLLPGRLEPEVEINAPVEPERCACIHVVHGAVDADGERLADGDAAAVDRELTLSARESTELLLFDLPA